jgi:hypothetical protein
MELIFVSITMSFGPIPISNWVFPGNKKPGYCKEKEITFVSIPATIIALHKASLKLAIPPLNGKAGPTMIAFRFLTDMIAKIVFLVHLLSYKKSKNEKNSYTIRQRCISVFMW